MVANTVSVTEERKTEEIHDTPQTTKGAVPLSDDGEQHAVSDVAGLQTVEVTPASVNESEPTPSTAVDEATPPSASATSPETPPVSPPVSTDGGKKGKQQKSSSSRFSLFGKKKKSRSETEDLKNAAERDAGDVDSRKKRSSLGSKTKSPKSPDLFDGDSGKRNSGGPFSFLSLKRSKSKPSSKVPGSESAPALDVDDGQSENAEKVIYELEVEGDVVAKVRPKFSSSGDRDRRSETAVATVDEAESAVDRPLDAGRHLVVVAIDFGTTFSGYAFSFVPDRVTTDGETCTRDGPIHMMRRWEGGDPGVINQKTLTALLLNPEGRFQAFGFTARNFYHDLDPTEAQRWMYFDKFKMALHSNPVGA